MEYQDKKIAILGLGIEGASLCNFLSNFNNSITVFDKLTAEELLEKSSPDLAKEISSLLQNKKIEFRLGADFNKLSEYDIVFRSPAIYFNDPEIRAAKKAGVKISSQISLFFELCRCTIIGVTGTKGKGTTSSLIYKILEAEVKSEGSKVKRNVYLAGNIGYPAITLLPKLHEKDIVVLELSNFQIADMDKSPHIAVITNLTVDHLDYHKDMEEYHLAKLNILLHQNQNDYVVLNKNVILPESLPVHAKRLYFSGRYDINSQAVVQENEKGMEVILDPRGRKIKVCSLDEIKLRGRHNMENIAAASLVADIFNVRVSVMQEAIKEFSGLPHRIEYIAEIDGVKYFNDSYATNPGPTMAAIKSFPGEKILILGGSSKGADFIELAYLISESRVRAVCLIGDEAEKIENALKQAHFQGEIFAGGEDFETVLKRVRKRAEKNDVVILSPACASFDMFKNYKDRGDKFRNAVLQLAGLS